MILYIGIRLGRGAKLRPIGIIHLFWILLILATDVKYCLCHISTLMLDSLFSLLFFFNQSLQFSYLSSLDLSFCCFFFSHFFSPVGHLL